MSRPRASDPEPLRLAIEAGTPRRSELGRRLAAGDETGRLIVRWHEIAADAEAEAATAREEAILARARLATLRRAVWTLAVLALMGWMLALA